MLERGDRTMSDLIFTGDIVVYLISLAAVWGSLLWRVSALEKKQDKHNNMIERTYKLEGKITEIEHDIKDIKGVLR